MLPVIAFLLDTTASVGASGTTVWLPIGILATATGIALATLWTTRASHSRRAISDLLEQLETTRLDLLMWRMDQLTRRGDRFWSTKPKDVDQLKREVAPDASALALVSQALATDWTSRTAHMHDVYHFALRVHTWLAPDRSTLMSLVTSGMRTSTKTRMLNDTFGYRLLGMFLDHRIIACRLRNARTADTYYPTHYGLFDPRYTELVRRLFDDLVYGPNMGANLWVFPKKYEAVSAFLRVAAPVEPPPEDDDAS